MAQPTAPVGGGRRGGGGGRRGGRGTVRVRGGRRKRGGQSMAKAGKIGNEGLRMGGNAIPRMRNSDFTLWCSH